MEKILKIPILVTIGFSIIGILQYLIFFPDADYSTIVSEPIWFINGVALLLVAGIALIMFVKLLPKYRKQHKLVTGLLLEYFLACGIASLVPGIMAFVNFQNLELRRLFEGINFYFIGLSTLLISFFIIEVFSEKGLNSQMSHRIILSLSLFYLYFFSYIFRHTFLLEFSFELYLYGGIFLLIGLVAYGLLAKKAFALKKRMEDPLMKRSFHYIGVSGLVIIMGYVVNFVYNLFFFSPIPDPIGIFLQLLSASGFLIGSLLIYIGFTLPMR